MDILRASLSTALVLAATVGAAQDTPKALERLKREAGVGELPSIELPAASPHAAACLRAACRRLEQEIDPTAYPYPATQRQREAEQARLATATREPVSTLSPVLRGVLDDLRALGASDVDLYHGSHFVITDEGRRYSAWSALGAFPRLSSHYRDVHVQQYEFRFPGLGVLLFGRTPDGSTWCQMEAHGSDPANALLHVGDYLKHQLKGGQNVGPDGLSPRTEASPLVLAPASRGLPPREAEGLEPR